MSATNNADLEQRCTSLRHELKGWEKQFASQHDGRRAGRDDIKANAIISQKYKQYNKIRDILSVKAVPQTPSKASRKRKILDDNDRTPKARPLNPTTTPSKRKYEDDEVAANVPDSASKSLSPQGPTMIGPTPQRDGIVLGLFDLLTAETPSKNRTVLNDVVPNIVQTPSKNHGKVESEGSIESRARGEKTPLSSGKRFLLDRFVTPKKRKLDIEGTPTSALEGFSTPAFLRRDNVLDSINEENEKTHRPAPWKRRGLGRSLSSMIQSMKRQENDRLDEEADIMREMEMEDEDIPIPKKPKLPEILVHDSQAPMPLGPDGAGESGDEVEENEAEDGLDQNGKAKKVWKKRGQKRQTRRVILRPSFVKPKPRPKPQAVGDDSSDRDPVGIPQMNPENEGSDHDFSGEDEASDYVSDDSHTPKKRKIQHKKSVDTSKKDAKDKATKQEGSVKAATRKIKATAHANYRRLKIKSKGAKGGKGLFGRRR